MNLYTFIMNYRGGTYISQHLAENINQVIELWVDNLNYENIEGIGKKSYNSFKEDMKKNPDFLYNMVEVEGIKNCWCWGNSINRSFALVNIIKTAKKISKN